MRRSPATSKPVRLSNRERGRWLRQRHRLLNALGKLDLPPDRVQAEMLERHFLRPVLKLSRRRAGREAYPTALQWHAKAARQCLDRLAQDDAATVAMEFENLKANLHACITMIDATLEQSGPTAMDEFVRKILGATPQLAPVSLPR
ncbi:hypothetical protein [Hoeflea prorocentri]|uniref:Uncharacterized protein n=1 Tax=Hoeflea prorocentri TaxID=1922333 RepID=A0A9X3ZHD3_9HYPH|nr:hypothetical protein [Hoeflea prorocentri]MCY6381209.1 hypothetical protein [Hoeflea prorocentri]MDA5399009.1 hypothetical protein [Hoeflea prorocentri]